MRIETSLECQGTTWEGHLLSMGVGSKGFLEEEIPELRLEQRAGTQPELKQNSYTNY